MLYRKINWEAYWKFTVPSTKFQKPWFREKTGTWSWMVFWDLTGAAEGLDTNCIFHICLIRCVQKAAEVSGRSSVHPITTSHSWAGFMNGNHLQKVRLDPALSGETSFICSLLCCFLVDAGGIRVTLEALRWPWLKCQRIRKYDSRAKAILRVFTNGS